MKVLVVRASFIILGLVIGYIFIQDQQKTRFYINNGSNLENLRVTISTSEQLIFQGDVKQNLVTHRYSEKQKIRLVHSDIIYLKVSLPTYDLSKEVMLNADGSDYIFININRLAETEYMESISVSSLNHDYVRSHMVPGL